MTSSLNNKWVLITGASSGFGAATARHFGAAGAHLLLGARRVERLEETAQVARKGGAKSVQVHFLDVTETTSVEAFVGWAKKITGKLDVLINNAGGAHGLDPVADAEDADWEATFQTNVLGLLRVTRACLPLMLKNPGSSIINIGSLAAHTPYENGAAYCGAKAAERAITQSLRLELCGSGVRVGTIDVGLAETEFSEVRFKGDKARAKKIYEGVQPLSADDVAEAIVWAASRPAHVCIDEMLIKCTAQAAIHKVDRRT